MIKKRLFLILVVVAALLALTSGAWAGAGGTPQASITLGNSDAALCNASQTPWSLTKTADSAKVDSGGTASWTVTATKGTASDTFLSVDGFVSVTNTGTANATIGNIVVNLQKRVGTNWVSASVDVADAINGDGATKDNIVAAASQENPTLNAANNSPPTYVVSGAKGTFYENAASGSLEFTLADNTVWAISPKQVLTPGQTVNLFFVAKFDNTKLGLAAGSQVRAEVIVTFGNAGARSGSGASATNIDINGNSLIDTDEANVRSVPVRFSKTVPAAKVCNDSVVLTDPAVTTSGDVVLLSPFNNGGIGDGVAVNATAIYTVTATVDGGDNGGTVCNAAFLTSQEGCTDCAVQVVIGTNPDLTPIIHIFPCCDDINLPASACVTVGKEPVGVIPIIPGDFNTYTQGGWGADPHGQNPGALLAAKFTTVYPSPNSFVEIGIPGTGGFSAIFNSALAIQNYLPAGGTADALDADLVNPTSTYAGVFGGQVLALQLNVDFSNVPINPPFKNALGGLKLCNLVAGDNDGVHLDATQAASLEGKTVSQVLADANGVLGGGSSIYGLSVSNLNELVTALNEAFEPLNDGTAHMSAFATNHLCH